MKLCPMCGCVSSPCLIGASGQFYCSNCRNPSYAPRWKDAPDAPITAVAKVDEPEEEPEEEKEQAASFAADVPEPTQPPPPPPEPQTVATLKPMELRCLRTLQELEAGTEPGKWHEPAEVFRYGSKRGFFSGDTPFVSVRALLLKAGEWVELRHHEFNKQKFTCRVNPAWCGVDVAKVVFEMESQNG